MNKHACRSLHGCDDDSGELPRLTPESFEHWRRMQALRRVALRVVIVLAACAAVAGLTLCMGCAGTDPMVKRMLERNRQVWEEDRREDLNPELVTSREREFDAQQRYLDSK